MPRFPLSPVARIPDPALPLDGARPQPTASPCSLKSP